MGSIITANKLVKYYGKARGITDVDLDVGKGEIYGFIGPNGAGKSTTIRILMNFIFPTSGTAAIFGMDATKESAVIKERVGYMPSELGFYDEITVKELLNYSAGFYNKDISKRTRELVDIFELDLNKYVHALSQGNKKKLGIVQALHHGPDLLILDEPTSGLDPLMQRRFLEVIKEENSRGATVFFSSHVLSEVERLCHRVAFIKDGRILQVEDMETLRQNRFRNVRLQFNGHVPALDLPGIVHSVSEKDTLNLLYNGGINELVRAMAEHDLLNMWLEEPTLESVFMHHYEKEMA